MLHRAYDRFRNIHAIACEHHEKIANESHSTIRSLPWSAGGNNQCPSAHLGSNGQTDFWVPRVSAISGRISFLARWGGPPRRARGNALSGLRGYEKGFSGDMVRTLSVKSVQSVVMPVGLMAVEITLQELNSRSDARAYLEVLLNGPRIARITRIRGKAINNDSRRSGVESGS